MLDTSLKSEINTTQKFPSEVENTRTKFVNPYIILARLRHNTKTSLWKDSRENTFSELKFDMHQ